MIIYSPLLTISGLVLSLLPFVGAIIVGGKLAVREKEISDQNANFMHFIKDNLIGFSTVKVFKSEKKIKELEQGIADEIEKQNKEIKEQMDKELDLLD